MEQLVQTGLSLVVAISVKVLMAMLTLLALIAVRQTSLMDRVVTVPIGNWFRVVAWGIFFVSLILTIGIILVV
jgi:hypothetical protein